MCVTLGSLAWTAEFDAVSARKHLVSRIVEGVKAGRNHTAYVEFMGRTARGRLVSATETGGEVEVAGEPVAFKWADMPTNRFCNLAGRYAGHSADDLASLAVLAAEAGATGKLEEHLSALEAMDAKRAGSLRARLLGTQSAGSGGASTHRVAGGQPMTASAGSAAGTAPLTTLTVSERSGVARNAWPVCTGVPIPRGKAPANPSFSLKAASGQEVPAQFEITGRWWTDRSPRWVLVNFQTDLPAGGSRQYVLSLAGRPGSVETPLRVSGGGGQVTVITGPLKFSVRAQGFNLIENVYYDPDGAFPAESRVVVAHRGGALVAAGGKTHLSSNGAAQLTMEERGPLRAVIRAEGSHLSQDGSKGLDYIARIYAYSGKAHLRIEYTFLNRQGNGFSSFVPLEEVSLIFPTTLAADSPPNFHLGGAKSVHSGRGAVGLFQDTSDRYVLSGALNGTVQSGKSDKTRSTGWGVVLGRGLAMGAAVRWFWQNHPKEIAVEKDGTLALRLFKGKYDLYQGCSKTHDVYLNFSGSSGAKDIAAIRCAIDEPLVAACPPRWYCRDTRVFGLLLESEPSLFTEKGRDILNRLDGAMDKGLASMKRRLDGNRDMGQGLDEYGIWDFGDDCQPQKGVNRSKETTYWNNNYYNFPHSLIVAFARTGKMDFLEFALPCARHLADMDISNYDSRQDYVGGPRICPGLMHYRSYMSGAPAVHNVFNHLKNRSLYDLWYLLGDRRAREVALLSSDHVVMRHNRGGADPGQARSVAHGIFCALDAFQLTHDQKYMDAAKRQIQIGMDFAAKNDGGYPYGGFCFMAGLMGEAYRKYYFMTHDPRMPEAQVRLADWMMKTHFDGRQLGGSTGMCTPALGHAYAVTGDPKYLDAALKDLDVWTLSGNGQRDSKHFAQSFKSSQYFLYYLSREFAPKAPHEGPWPDSRF